MKRILQAFAMCQSMFCAIPSLWQGWNEKARNILLLFLPVVGLEIGLIWTGLGWLCRYLGLPLFIRALILGIYPYLVTGFMHLDGFMDVTDAVNSWRDLERRREILKDSHVGSFSVIGCILLILSQFAVFASLPLNVNLWMLTLIPVVSRCGSALAVTVLKPMTTSQYAGNTFRKSHVVVILVMLLAALTAGFLMGGLSGLCLLGGVAGYGLALLRAYRSLKGMNGDIAGYCLTFSELAAAAVLVFV